MGFMGYLWTVNALLTVDTRCQRSSSLEKQTTQRLRYVNAVNGTSESAFVKPKLKAMSMNGITKMIKYQVTK